MTLLFESAQVVMLLQVLYWSLTKLMEVRLAARSPSSQIAAVMSEVRLCNFFQHPFWLVTYKPSYHLSCWQCC